MGQECYVFAASKIGGELVVSNNRKQRLDPSGNTKQKTPGKKGLEQKKMVTLKFR